MRKRGSFVWFAAALIAVLMSLQTPVLAKGPAVVSSNRTTPLSDELATPVLVSAVNVQEGIKITWESVPGAVKYNVYRKPTGSSWSGKYFYVTTDTSYTDTEPLTVGTSYSYTVRAVKGNTLSDYDRNGVQAVALPAQPALKTPQTVGETSLKISWDAVEGADFYRVYKQDETGDWKRLARNVKNTYFVDDNASSEKETVYTVRSGKNVDGTAVLSVYEATVTGKTVSKEEAAANFQSPTLRNAEEIDAVTINVSWNGAAGADGYLVYRKRPGKKWKLLATVEGAGTLEYADSTCKYGKEYIYTVRAYRSYGEDIIKSVNYDAAGVSASTVLKKPKLVSAKPVDNRTGIKVTWEGQKGVSSHRVYRKEKGGKWKLLKTVKSKNEYTDNTVKQNKVYYYTVRAQVKSGGKQYLSGYKKSGIKGSTKYKKKTVKGLILYYDAAGNLITDTEPIIGKQSSYRIEIDYDKNIVTVYARSSGSNYNVPVKAFVCSTGKASPIGTFSTPAKYRWHTLNGPCYGQWCTRIHGGVLFHSVPYYTESNNNLKVYAYNKLGTKCSAGCIRLCCRDAKWIYDNCKLGTRVTIKHNARNPLGKPKSLKLKKWHTWDPTDPNMAYKCRAKGCH